MKLLVIALVISNVAMSTPEAKRKTVSVQPIKTATKSKDVAKTEEDCDEKAKKKVEIKEDSINLLGGNTGCTLEE